MAGEVIPSGPVFQADGTLSHSWRRFFIDVWHKLGKSTDNAPITAENIYGILASLNLANNAQVNCTNFATVDSVDNGSNATIRVYGVGGVGSTWTRTVGSTSYGPYPALSQAGNTYAHDYYVIYNPTTSSFVISDQFADILPDNFIWVGKVHTVSAGGAGGTSGGGGSSGGGGGICFVGNGTVKTQDGIKQWYTLPTYPVLWTTKGWREAKLIISPYEGWVHNYWKDEWVTPGHPFWRDAWVQAHELFCRRKPFIGNVYNAHILDHNKKTHNYELGNGEVVHNISMSTL